MDIDSLLSILMILVNFLLNGNVGFQVNGGFSFDKGASLWKISLILMGKATVHGNDASEMTCFRFD